VFRHSDWKDFYGDVIEEDPPNMPVPLGNPIQNTSIPESTLSKKHNAINYHIIREAVAAGIIRVGKEDTLTNIAKDVFTKLVPFTRKYKLLSPFLWDW
jgi:hypothetical protein